MTGSLTFVGTATTLLQYGGFTLLTDPNFLHRGQRAYLGHGLWSTRRTEPALQPEQLPPLDAVVLSHVHGDHWDRVARRALPRDTRILTTPQSARRLRHQGFDAAQALQTWQSTVLTRPDGSRLVVTAVPGRHALGPLQALLPHLMGSVLQFSPADGSPPLTAYLSGDTLLHDALRELPGRFPTLDLGVLHLGGTRIPGFAGKGLLVTLDAPMGADLLELLGPVTTVPVHYDDYGVFTSPLEDFLAEVARRGLPGVRPLARGEALPLPVS